MTDTARSTGHTESPASVNVFNGWNHPYVPPSLSANTRRNIPVATSSAPGTSMPTRCLAGALRPITIIAPAMASGAMMTLIPNAHRHE